LWCTQCRRRRASASSSCCRRISNTRSGWKKAGILFAAGPVANENGSPAGGLIVIRAESFEAARAIADSDPLHKAGLRTYTIWRWTVNEGSYGVRVNYSDQSVTIE
jgi:uncharacterized protein